MVNYMEELEEYVSDNIIYNMYLQKPDGYYNDAEWVVIQHTEAVKWAIDELNALYQLVAEMRNKYENITPRK